MGTFVEIEKTGRIAVLWLSRPDSLNAIGTHDDCEDLIDALRTIDEDRDIAAAVLTGRGRAFCSGGNLKAMKDRVGIGPRDEPDDTRVNYRRGVQRITRTFLDIEVPVIAAVNGHAIGLGCDLACLCDVRLAADSANFSASFVKVGIVPGDGGAWSLQRVVGYSTAAEMFLTGDRYSAEQALALGLVSRVVPDSDLLCEALGLAGRIAANPPRAVRLTKRLLRESQHQRLSDVLELSAAFQALAHETSDHAEAVDALLEKRDAQFTGR